MIGHFFRTALFSFSDQENPCHYWTGGRHIVVEGKCRCGREFVVMERMPAEFALDSTIFPGGEL